MTATDEQSTPKKHQHRESSKELEGLAEPKFPWDLKIWSVIELTQPGLLQPIS